MKFAFSRPTSDDEQQRTLLSSFAEIGYDGLQLKAGQYARYLHDPQAFLADWGDFPGAPAGLITGGNLDGECVANLREVLRFARFARSDLVIFCLLVPRRGLSRQDIQSLARQMSEFGAEARQLGTKLSLHNHFDSPVMYREDFDVFYDAVYKNTVGLTVDTAHLVKSGVEDIADVISSFAAVIDNFHLKDFADGEWKVLGEGRIDFIPVFRAIREIGYDGWVSTDEESGSELLGAMRSCLEFMKVGLA